VAQDTRIAYRSSVTPQWRVENPAERVSTNADAIRFTVASGSGGSVVASSPTDDQRVLLRASKLLHHVLACQRLPHRPERFLIHQPHRTPPAVYFAPRPLLCARSRVRGNFPYSRCAACRPRNGRCRRSARVDCSGLSSTLKSPIQNRTSPVR